MPRTRGAVCLGVSRVRLLQHRGQLDGALPLSDLVGGLPGQQVFQETEFIAGICLHQQHLDLFVVHRDVGLQGVVVRVGFARQHFRLDDQGERAFPRRPVLQGWPLRLPVGGQFHFGPGQCFLLACLSQTDRQHLSRITVGSDGEADGQHVVDVDRVVHERIAQLDISC